MMAQSTKTKRFVFPRDMSSGSNTNLKQIKQQLKTNNVLKHIGQLPQDLCIIYDLAFEYKCTQMGSSLSIHIIQTLVMFMESNKIQYQFKEWCSTQCRIASPRMGSLHFLTQEGIKQILSRATRIQNMQGRQMRVRSKQILGNKIRQFKARDKVKMVYKFHHNYEYRLSWTRSIQRYFSVVYRNDIEDQFHNK